MSVHESEKHQQKGKKRKRKPETQAQKDRRNKLRRERRERERRAYEEEVKRTGNFDLLSPASLRYNKTKLKKNPNWKRQKTSRQYDEEISKMKDKKKAAEWRANNQDQIHELRLKHADLLAIRRQDPEFDRQFRKRQKINDANRRTKRPSGRQQFFQDQSLQNIEVIDVLSDEFVINVQ